MKEIVFATNNRHKLEEIRKITKGTLHILSLSDIHCADEIEETGTTLEENALLKARYVKEKYGYDCFAMTRGWKWRRWTVHPASTLRVMPAKHVTPWTICRNYFL